MNKIKEAATYAWQHDLVKFSPTRLGPNGNEIAMFISGIDAVICFLENYADTHDKSKYQHIQSASDFALEIHKHFFREETDDPQTNPRPDF